MELTQFLARKILKRGNHSGKDVVVAWSSQCKTAHKDIRAYLESNQKEPDTKLLLNSGKLRPGPAFLSRKSEGGGLTSLAF